MRVLHPGLLRVAELEPAIRGLKRLLPRRIKRAGRSARAWLDRPRWGNLARLEPFSHSYGFDRGTPVDRVYIERFLTRHTADVRGAVLEVMNADYTRQFGADRVDRSDVLDIDPTNTAATVVADLAVPESLPRERYDCFILTQTICLVTEPDTAVANAWRALRPGGTLLMTEPALCRHEPHPGINDLWRFSPAGMTTLLRRCLPDAEIDVVGLGNLVTSIAYLHGLAAEELDPPGWEVNDPHFPVIAAARVVKEPA